MKPCDRKVLYEFMAALLNKKTPGNDIFSHTLASAVSSALKRFTSVFGMGTGGSPPLLSPGKLNSNTNAFRIIRRK